MALACVHHAPHLVHRTTDIARVDGIGEFPRWNRSRFTDKRLDVAGFEFRPVGEGRLEKPQERSEPRHVLAEPFDHHLLRGRGQAHRRRRHPLVEPTLAALGGLRDPRVDDAPPTRLDRIAQLLRNRMGVRPRRQRLVPHDQQLRGRVGIGRIGDERAERLDVEPAGVAHDDDAIAEHRYRCGGHHRIGDVIVVTTEQVDHLVGVAIADERLERRLRRLAEEHRVGALQHDDRFAHRPTAPASSAPASSAERRAATRAS